MSFKQDLLNKSIAECREKLNILKSTQAQVQEQFNKGEITEQQYRDFQREIVATEQKLKNLEKEAKSFGSVGAQQVAAVGTKMQRPPFANARAVGTTGDCGCGVS